MSFIENTAAKRGDVQSPLSDSTRLHCWCQLSGDGLSPIKVLESDAIPEGAIPP